MLSLETFQPTQRQLEAYKAQERFILYGGAMGGGKTVWLCGGGLRLSIDFPGNTGYMCRKTYKDFKKTTLPVLMEMLPQSLIKTYNKTDGEIILKNNSLIILGDLENTDKLKSLNLGWYAIDEVTDTEEDRYLMLNTRLRKNIPGIVYKGLMASNPEPGWVKDRFVDPQIRGRTYKNHRYINALPKDNPYLPEEYLESFKDMPPLWRTKYAEGSWDVFDSQIFKPDWIKPGLARNNEYVMKVTAVDPAIGEKDENDETAIVTLGIGFDNVIYEVETVHGRWSFDKIVDNCISVYQRHKPEFFGVEIVAFQKALKDVLSKRGLHVIPLKADSDKIRRAIAITDLFEKDLVRINNPDLQKQCLEFPKGQHDDLVDAMCYALRIIKNVSEDKYERKEDPYKNLDSASRQFWKEHYGEQEKTEYTIYEEFI